MKRLVRAGIVAAFAATASLLVAAPVGAATRHVHAGESIQLAIDQAKPGDKIVVDPGVYAENLTITKNNLTLLGAGIHATILQPGVTHPSPCVDPSDPSTVNGICVLGEVDFSTFAPIGQPVKGTKIDGFTVQGFPGFGVFLYHADESSVTNTEAADNDGYGISGFVLSGVRFEDDIAHDNGEPGLYVGDSPRANAHIVGNTSYANGVGGPEGIGILLRDSSHGDVRENNVYDNCAGIVFADTGEDPVPVEHWDAAHNSILHNNGVCTGEEEGPPPMSGVGILLLGGQHINLHDNTVLGNAGATFPFSGGIVVLDSSGIGGSAPEHDHVNHNTAHDNVPFDVFWDGSGSHNSFKGNDCTTSLPSWICGS